MRKMLKVENVKVNYSFNSLGITKQPIFSWILCSDGKNIMQKKYRIQISEDDNFHNIVLDTFDVDSSNSAHVRVDNFNMKSSQRYYSRIKIKDNRDNISQWSDTCEFVTGLLSSSLWNGEFITGESEEDIDKSKGTYLRKKFILKKKIKSAYVHSTALGMYKFYVNGEKVGHDELTPGWTSYRNRLLYQTYDVTELLKQGENTIGAVVGAGWYKGTIGLELTRNNYGDYTAFLCQINIEYEDGSKGVVCTDDTWKCENSPIVFSEIYDGEVYDSRLEKENWAVCDFNDSDWLKVKIIKYDKKVLTSQPSCRVKKIQEIVAKSLITTPEGDTVIDFGQNLTGWIKFKVKGKRGDIIEIKCFEVLDKDGNVYTKNLRTAKQTIKYICKDGNEVEYSPNFTFQGFRYAQIKSYPGKIEKKNFVAEVIHSDMEETLNFECSNKYINQLQHNILWGMKGNFIDIPTDCPQRDERLGWTGDAQIFSRTASYLMNTYNFFDKWLKDLKADQSDQKGVPFVVPDIISPFEYDEDSLFSKGTYSASGWADAAVIVPWNLYLMFGNVNILIEQYESMKSWIDFMDKHAIDGVWNYKLQFGDWLALDGKEGERFGGTPNELTCTAYYVYSTGIFSKVAKIIGKKEDYLKYGSLYSNIVKSFQNHFFNDDGSMTVMTQTAHVLALYFDLCPQKYKKKTVDTLVSLLRKENGHLVTGFIGTPYICHALSQNGYTEQAYKLLLKDDFPSWLYQVKKGATTIWEHWDGIKEDGSMWSPEMNSFNHYSYGAIGEWLYRTAAGIEVDENNPGYKKIIIYPHIDKSLDYLKASYQSIYGEIQVEWSIKCNLVNLKIKIPHNTTADICLDKVYEITKSDNLCFTVQDNKMTAKTGSGQYNICFIQKD